MEDYDFRAGRGVDVDALSDLLADADAYDEAAELGVPEAEDLLHGVARGLRDRAAALVRP